MNKDYEWFSSNIYQSPDSNFSGNKNLFLATNKNSECLSMFDKKSDLQDACINCAWCRFYWHASANLETISHFSYECCIFHHFIFHVLFQNQTSQCCIINVDTKSTSKHVITFDAFLAVALNQIIILYPLVILNPSNFKLWLKIISFGYFHHCNKTCAIISEPAWVCTNY